MKRCPTCNKTFSDPNLVYCLDDGTPLSSVEPSADETTIVSPSSGERMQNPPPIDVVKPRDWQTINYQPPDFSGSNQAARKNKTWVWVVGILAVIVVGLVGLGIAAALLIPNIMRAAANKNSSNTNIERSDADNANGNSNSIGFDPNSNDKKDADTGTDSNVTTPPPSDEGQVLAELTDLEHEWTVANINADKKTLNRILADDYVGMLENGSQQGKAEYINSIEHDTSIQQWDFEDLKLKLDGARASLSGVIRLQLRNQQAAYRFTDKFVWRNGRWQAVGSDVKQIE